MEVSEVLKKAWAAVEEAELPADIRPVAFREAVRLLRPDTPVATAPGPRASKQRTLSAVGKAANDASGADEVVDADEGEIYARVSEHTGVDRTKLEGIVHLDDDGLRVSLPGLKLGKNNAERARIVAQVLTVTRGFGLGEAETPLDVIRTECVRLKVYDSANFSAHISSIGGFVVNGSGQNRRVRAKSAGIANFAGLVDSLLADS